MNEKEIAMNIVFKMLEMKALTLAKTNDNDSAEQAVQKNQKNIETVCNAYKTVYQTVKQN